LYELADKTLLLKLSAAGCTRKPAPIIGCWLNLNYKGTVNGRPFKNHDNNLDAFSDVLEKLPVLQSTSGVACVGGMNWPLGNFPDRERTASGVTT